MVNPKGKSSRPTTSWNEKSHEAGAHGTGILRALLPGRQFPFPKSLYAVEDCLRCRTPAFVADKPNSIVLDFFSGSGTTAHAVMRLNRQDDGHRQCILVTNNEVAADEHWALQRAGFRTGEPDWEQRGICDYVTKPRISAAITGKTPDGEDIQGEYKFIDEFPMAEGFKENAAFFTLTYETPVAISHNLAFQRVAPLLWMRAGRWAGELTSCLNEDGRLSRHTECSSTSIDRLSSIMRLRHNLAFVLLTLSRMTTAASSPSHAVCPAEWSLFGSTSPIYPIFVIQLAASE